MGTMVRFNRPDGQAVQGYLAEPAQTADAPAIVVIQEWWGLNAQIRGVADRLASAGFQALVPDLYRGKSTVEAEEAHHLMSGLDFGDAASQDIRGAVQYLKGRAAKGAPMKGGKGADVAGAFASLCPTLLARKGGARPAMRPQLAANRPGEAQDGFIGDVDSDLGWNDFGDPEFSGPAAAGPAQVVSIAAERAAPAEGALPAVMRQRKAAEQRITASSTPSPIAPAITSATTHTGNPRAGSAFASAAAAPRNLTGPSGV